MYFLPRYREKFNTLKGEELKSIDDVSDICRKMESLTSILEIPAVEVDLRCSAIAELQELLRKYYPDCLLLTFGSSINGFEMKHSELDLLFLPFPEYCNMDCHTKGDAITPAPEPSSILTGETSRDFLLKLNEYSHLKFIRSILRLENKLVSKANLLTLTILKINFVNEVVCKLFASNRLVVFNSELLHFYQKLDARVKPLVFTLRYWANISGFIKRTIFSSYAFTMLVIFFLQNTSPPVLPSVQHLIEISGFSRIIAGWETAFPTDINLIPKSKNTETTADLLMHFFQFYWNFDFVQYIVSPYKGAPIPVKDIKNSQDERMANFGVVSVNIQDPFVLSTNICRRDIMNNVFKVALFTTYHMLLNKNEKFKFSSLFDPLEYDKIYSLQYERCLIGKQRPVFINLHYESFANICKDSSNLLAWHEKACQTLLDVLQYGLLIECEVTDKICWECKTSPIGKDNDIEPNNGTPSVDLMETSNVKNTPFELELLLSIQCIVYSRTWLGREHCSQVSEVEDEFEEFAHPVLKAEHHISKSLFEKDPPADNSEPLLRFKGECYKHTSPQMPGVILILRPLASSRDFHNASTFISVFLPKTVRKILSPEI